MTNRAPPNSVWQRKRTHIVLAAVLTAVALTAPAHGMEKNSIETVLKGIADRVPGLRFITLRRSDGTIQATFRGFSSTDGADNLVSRRPQIVMVTTVELETEEAASLEERRMVLLTPVSGSKADWKGLSLHVWGADTDQGTYRVTTRVGATVVDVAANPPLTKFVLPVLDDLVQQLRQ